VVETRAPDAYDIQSVAAHEIGHVLQFDHVTNQSKRDYTELMWPYLDIGDTTAASSAAATRSRTTATTEERPGRAA
jgi:predicted Zn-dependent protease